MTRDGFRNVNRCPVQEIFDRLGGQWTVLVLMRLDDSGTMRFNELRTNIAGVSQRMLAQTLRRLEEYGLVTRTPYPTIPPKVEYALTPLGRSLLQPLRGVIAWVQRNDSKVRRAQAAYERPPRQHAL